MKLFGEFKIFMFDTIKPLIYTIYDYFNKIFERKEFNKLLKIYILINGCKTVLYKLEELLFSRDNISNKHLKANVYYVEEVIEFCKQNDYKYTIVEEVKNREVCIPYYSNRMQDEKIINAYSPEIYVAEIKNASIIGENNVVLVDEYCLNDMAKRDDRKRYNLRFGSVRNINKEYAIIQSIKSDVNIDMAISLIGFAAFNYYHFAIELISRLSYIDRTDEYDGIPLMVDEVALKIPQFRQMLENLNKKNREIIPIKKNFLYNVDHLIYPSYNSWLPINLKKGEELIPEDFLMSKESIHYVKNIIYENIESTIDSTDEKKRIFISRRNMKNARLKNEAQVIEIIKQYNFEIVYPEDLTFRQQVQLFSQAEYVAGTTGAAFTNIIFCPENAKIMCIIPQRYKYYGYSTLAKMFNLKCIFLDAEVISQKEAISMEFYKMDLEYLKRCLEELNL